MSRNVDVVARASVRSGFSELRHTCSSPCSAELMQVALAEQGQCKMKLLLEWHAAINASNEIPVLCLRTLGGIFMKCPSSGPRGL